MSEKFQLVLDVAQKAQVLPGSCPVGPQHPVSRPGLAVIS